MIIVKDNSNRHKQLILLLPVIYILLILLEYFLTLNEIMGYILLIIGIIYSFITYYYLQYVPNWKEVGNIIYNHNSFVIDYFKQNNQFIYEDIDSVYIKISGYQIVSWFFIFDLRPKNKIILKFNNNILDEKFLINGKKGFLNLIHEIKLLSEYNVPISINTQNSRLKQDEIKMLKKFHNLK